MGCACQGRSRELFEVVSSDGTKVLFGPTSSRPTADSVSARYPGSTVRLKDGTAPAAKTA